MDLSKLFHPSSIAIVGVSHDPKKVGYLVAKNLIDQGYTGEIYFVNKNAGEKILDRAVYPDINTIGKPIDLAVLAVPAEIAISYLDELNALGIKNVVLYAAGFKEIGSEGDAHEKALIEKVKAYGIHLLGPNCIGYINTQLAINLTFLKTIAPKGNIGFISQSGALGSVLVDYLSGHTNLGFSYFISIGNKTVVDEIAALEFLLADANTQVIGLYLEGVTQGKRFIELLTKANTVKPVVILKAGSTKEGSRAALSHTGGLVGDDSVFEAVCRQTGTIRAHSFDEFMDIVKIYSFKRVPTSPSMLVLSNAGGVGVLYTDDLLKHGLQLVTVSKEIQEKLTEGETKKITVHNPIDLLGDASAFDYERAITSTIQEKDIGAVSVLLTPQANTQIEETAQVIAGIQEKFDKPIYPIFMGDASVRSAHALFEKNHMASFFSYDSIPGAVASILWQQHKRSHVPVSDIRSQKVYELSIQANKAEIEKILSENKKPFLNLQESENVIKLLGIPTEPVHLATTEAELATIAQTVSFPLVVKIASDIITHKTEVNGVKTNIKTLPELQTAYTGLVAKTGTKGAYIQKMRNGFEVFIGAKRDKSFGIVLVIGLGGVMAELIKDVSQRVYPFSKTEFDEMVGETKVSRLIAGFRGSKPMATDGLYQIFMQLGAFMEVFPQVESVDINPLFLSESPIAVDYRIVLSI